jgi:outer membrane protein
MAVVKYLFKKHCPASIYLTLALLSCTSSSLSMNHPWSLEECIAYALSSNPDVRIQELAYEDKIIDHNTEKNAWLPKVSMGSTQLFTFGRSLTYENTYSNTSTRQTTFSLSGEMTLFDGLRQHYEVKMANDLMRQEEYLLKQTKMNLTMKVAEAYMQVLLDIESLDIAEQQVKIDSMQTSRMNHLFAHGKASYVDITQQKATLQNSIAKSVESQNQLQIDQLALCQLMNFRDSTTITIVKFEEKDLISMLPAKPDVIYEHAITHYPDILSQKAAISSSENKIKIYQSDRYPQLSLVGGIGSNYYKTNGLSNGSFGNQMKNNFSQEIQLQLTIPIFNRFSTRNNIRKANVEKTENEYRLMKKEQELYKEISQTYARAMNAYSNIESYSKAVESSREAFKLMSKKYECGKATQVEFDDSKTKLLKALSTRIQAVYEYIYQCRLLDFYQQNPA